MTMFKEVRPTVSTSATAVPHQELRAILNSSILKNERREKEEMVIITLKAADAIHPCHGFKVAS